MIYSHQQSYSSLPRECRCSGLAHRLLGSKVTATVSPCIALFMPSLPTTST